METAILIADIIKHAIWPVTVLIIITRFRNELSDLLFRTNKIQLPGGVQVEAFSARLRAAEPAAERVKQEQAFESGKRGGAFVEELRSPEQVNERLIQLQLNPLVSGLDMNYFRNLSYQTPAQALTALRLDTSTLLKDLARALSIPYTDLDSIDMLAGKLLSQNRIDQSKYQLLKTIDDLTAPEYLRSDVSAEQVNQLLHMAQPLADAARTWLTVGCPQVVQ